MRQWSTLIKRKIPHHIKTQKATGPQGYFTRFLEIFRRVCSRVNTHIFAAKIILIFFTYKNVGHFFLIQKFGQFVSKAL